MSVELLKTEEEQPERGWVPKVITGGKGPPDYPGDPNNPDWLSGMPVHTTFLIKGKKNTSFILGQVTIVHALNKGRLLFIPSQSKEPVWVDPIGFCSDYRYYETIQSAEEFDLETKANLKVEEENANRAF